jgi:hypothetical protein
MQKRLVVAFGQTHVTEESWLDLEAMAQVQGQAHACLSRWRLA